MALPLPQIDEKQETVKISDFLVHQFATARKKTAIIALSGGIDSAVSLMLTVKALKPQNVQVLHMPAKKTNPIHTKHSKLVAKTAQIPPENFTQINIGSIIQKSWRIINHYTLDEPLPPKSTPGRSAKTKSLSASNRLRLANLAARVRMLVLYDQAKKHDALVIGTENFSEHLLGYYTRFGDEASDLEPIKHLYKTHIRQLAKYLNIPQEILTKAPSADLWQGQTDENEMGFSYETADPILYHYHKGLSETEIVSQGYPLDIVRAVVSQVQLSRFKHEVPYSLPHK